MKIVKKVESYIRRGIIFIVNNNWYKVVKYGYGFICKLFKYYVMGGIVGFGNI